MFAADTRSISHLLKEHKGTKMLTHYASQDWS